MKINSATSQSKLSLVFLHSCTGLVQLSMFLILLFFTADIAHPASLDVCCQSGLWTEYSDTAIGIPTGRVVSSNTATTWCYTQDAIFTYDVGTRTIGDLFSATPHLVTSGGSLTFWSWSEVEGTPDYDTRKIYVSSDGGNTYVEIFNETGPLNEWHQIELDLSSFAGENIVVKFEFDSVDFAFNNFLGWCVDDIELIIPVNNAPADISLSSDTVPENSPTATFVGTLVTTDPDN